MRSFLAQYFCEVVTFISYYIYMTASDEIDRICERLQADEEFNFHSLFGNSCVSFIRKTGLGAAAVIFICVYTPIRVYAFRNMYYWREELKHELEQASDVTDELEKAKSNQIRSEKIETGNRGEIQLMEGVGDEKDKEEN